MSSAEIKKLLGKKELIIGTDRVLKNLRNRKITKVFLSSNCNADTISEIKHLGEDVEIEEMNLPNDELGVVCKKPFAVSVIGILK